jgi:RimJ/RimL family protein N-acetyltransferase
MMKQVIYGQDERVAKWVGDQIDEVYLPGSAAIGLEENGELIAGVVFDHYTGPSISMHVAATGKRWMTKDFLWRCFAYPFIQLQCNRITGLVRVDNLAAQKFDEHLGFVKEGLLRKAAKDGTDYIVYGMLREECRWLEIRT